MPATIGFQDPSIGSARLSVQSNKLVSLHPFARKRVEPPPPFLRSKGDAGDGVTQLRRREKHISAVFYNPSTMRTLCRSMTKIYSKGAKIRQFTLTFKKMYPYLQAPQIVCGQTCGERYQVTRNSWLPNLISY